MPYGTDKFTPYAVDVIFTRLSFAVWPVDDYTKKEPVGRISVMIKQGDGKAVKNLSGYYTFTNLPDGIYTVVIESDWYFSEEKAVDISLLDSRKPVVEIELKPKPSYPFPDHATLVRGLILNAEQAVNAEVTVPGKAIKTIVDARGEFVLYFKGNEPESITIEIKKGADVKTVSTTIEEGKTISLVIIDFP
ncbi:MAG: carboxypeptidase-like regulatory domain-containing protein [Nitrospirae bacterium]|nr:carboxypeptidase-like regulatory domain-containing protein [Nitrospirota bacterium]